MTVIIYKDGQYINRIVANETFAKSYCEANGYTYEMVADPEPEPAPEPDPTYTTDDLMAALLGG